MKEFAAELVGTMVGGFAALVFERWAAHRIRPKKPPSVRPRPGGYWN